MNKTIKIDYITKIEGHAKLFIKIDEGIVEDVRLEVFEGARFFEGLLLGKKFDEVPIITSRICGVCPQAHSLASIIATEKAFGIKVNETVNNLREVLLIGQIMKSHTLHLFFLALPDYFGKESIIELAKSRKDLIELGITLKKVANDITSIIGGREIHSITNVVGGFSKNVDDKKIKELIGLIDSNLDNALEAIKLFSGFDIPNFENKTQYLVLKNEKGISLFGNQICSENICNSIENYKNLMEEFIEKYSTAKHVTINDKSFFVGALARMNNLKLSSEVKKIVGDVFPSFNTYHNNLAQCVEVYELMKKAKTLLKKSLNQNYSLVDVKPKKSKAICALEAPRGILFHEYEYDKEGYVTKANIITPTTQNLKNLEEDIKKILPSLLKNKKEKEIVMEIEKLIRAYDPCISCSTHFLQVIWDK